MKQRVMDLLSVDESYRDYLNLAKGCFYEPRQDIYDLNPGVKREVSESYSLLEQLLPKVRLQNHLH